MSAGTDGVGTTWHLYPEVVDERPLVLAHGQLVRPLVNDVDAEQREVRQIFDSDSDASRRKIFSRSSPRRQAIRDIHRHRHVVDILKASSA